MADQRVHPTTSDSPSSSSSTDTSSNQSGEYPKPPNPPPSKPVPLPAATYVFQLPKEQIFRYPPPENAKRFEALTQRKSRSSCCRRCCCFTFCLLFFLVIAAAVSAGVLYLVFRFKSPNYTITNIAIVGMNLTSSSPISPGFNVTIRAENPNGKVGIFYLKDSAVTVFHNGVKFSDGVLPVFYQPRKNATMIHLNLSESNVVVGSAVRTALSIEQSNGKVPFEVRLKAPVKLKVGLAKTWIFTFKVKCDIVTDTVDEKAKIVSSNCDYRVRLW